jgi:DNA-binding IclR family transcriptional regulator
VSHSTAPKAFAAVRWARDRRIPWTVRQLSDALGCHDSTARRCIRRMLEHGLLEQESGAGYDEFRPGWTPARYRWIP